MNPNGIVTLQSYRHEDCFCITVARDDEKSLNRGAVFYSGLGEHKGIYVYQSIYDRPELEGSLQIPIVCNMSDKGQTWTEVRRLVFSFKSGYPEDGCHSAAQDFHHDLLHPEIFKRDYIGFIINMIKIIQHRYPQILRVHCSFEKIKPDNSLLEEVLKYMQNAPLEFHTAHQIAADLLMDCSDVETALNALIMKNLVRRVGSDYILVTGTDEERLPSLIMHLLKDGGLTLTGIADLSGQSPKRVESALRMLLSSDLVEFTGGLYYSKELPPSYSDIERLLELLDSVNPEGMTLAQVCRESAFEGKTEGYMSAMLGYVVQEGYVCEEGGCYYIKRLEDSEIELVNQTVKSNPGINSDAILRATGLCEVVVASSLNVLVERGFVREEAERYYPTKMDISRDIVEKVYDMVPLPGSKGADPSLLSGLLGAESVTVLDYLTEAKLLCREGMVYYKLAVTDSEILRVVTVVSESGGMVLQDIEGKFPDLSRERVWIILRDLVAADKLVKRGELYSVPAETHCTDHEIGRVLRELESAHPLGVSQADIAKLTNMSRGVVDRALSNLISRSFVTQSGDEFFSRSFPDDCEEIIDLLRNVHPNGMVLSDVCSLVGITYQPLVKSILQYLIDGNLVEMFGKLYFLKSAERTSDVLQILAEAYPCGLTLEELQKKSSPPPTASDLQSLVSQKMIYLEMDRYFYNQGSSLTDEDYQEVLRALEAAYPNSLNLYSLARESNLTEQNVALILHSLVDRMKVTEVDRDVFVRREGATEHAREIRGFGPMGQPTIAVITFDYSVKTSLDSMMRDIQTYYKYKMGGESSIYTLGTIGQRRVVVTKFSHGDSQASMIATGNATTRLLGSFSNIEHVIILGLGGGVVDAFRTVRLGDVVVSYPGEDNSIYHMATDFKFSDGSNRADSTVTYRVKRWNCIDSQLYTLAKRLFDQTKDEAVFPWERYITQGQNCLSHQDFHRPPEMTDAQSIKLGHPRSGREGRPRMRLGAIGAGKDLHKMEELKDQFVERSGVIAFNSDFCHVTESIHGNCMESFIFIHGISDYTDGTTGEMWESYASLAAAALTRFIVENL